MATAAQKIQHWPNCPINFSAFLRRVGCNPGSEVLAAERKEKGLPSLAKRLKACSVNQQSVWTLVGLLLALS